ncbi:hypothetical protein MVEN_01996800 [Mycena venus]|uniref:Uncharacterized protein n=1 Tax=Mycena venus TaxID=2733690 RepID=A0A8H6XD80_9AGAR|nr:hypothetical protein MVEN_01996800 [Mycena venus]
MSASARKDRCSGLAIHYAPADISQQEFKAKVDTLVDSFLALPVCQKNFLNFNVIYPNSRLGEIMKLSGIGQPTPNIWFEFECETEDHLTEIIGDEQFKNLFAGAKDLGFLDSASFFTADVTTKVDVPPPAPNARVQSSFAAKIPKDMSADEFHANLEPVIDGYVQLPVCQKHILKHTYWRQNTNIANEVRTLGYPEAEGLVVVLQEVETWNALVEIMDDETYKRLMFETLHKVLPGIETWGISLDVVTKISTT